MPPTLNEEKIINATKYYSSRVKYSFLLSPSQQKFLKGEMDLGY
jgi:hypothetical protein